MIVKDEARKKRVIIDKIKLYQKVADEHINHANICLDKVTELKKELEPATAGVSSGSVVYPLVNGNLMMTDRQQEAQK